MTPATPASLHRRHSDSLGYYIVCVLTNGSVTVFGKTHMTERGSRASLSRYARQFGLTKTADIDVYTKTGELPA